MAIHNLSHSLQPFYGDIHNHCDISYGHGPLEDAYANARMQLDFASVTGHSSWPDLPERDDRLAAVVDYHRNGFQKLENNWRQYVDVTETQNTPGQFVTLFSYEWHSLRFGDYVVYFKKPIEKMLKPSNLEEFRSMLQEQRKRGNDALLIPHHIGYKTGYRGINWEAFTEEFSPAVEIISMHGCAESDDAPRNYFHTMGPRNAKNTLQAGLATGYHVAVTGSTDHHSAHPGSFGYGLTGVWAESLTRDSLWNAIKTRRTWALTGDRISLAFSINGYPLGSVLPFSKERKIEVEIRGGYSLNYIEILKNNRVLHHESYRPTRNIHTRAGLLGKVFLEVGWGKQDVRQEWEVFLQVQNGRLLSVEPRFRGIDIVAPKADHNQEYRLAEWNRKAEDEVHFRAVTRGNSTVTTNENQGMSLEIEGTPETLLRVRVNQKKIEHTLTDLLDGSVSHYLGSFLTGAIRFHRFIPEDEYAVNFSFEDISTERREDFYYLRVCQKNDQWAWSSPIWIERE